MEGWQLGLTLLMAFKARVAAPYAAERLFVFCWTVWNSKIRSFSDIAPQRREQQLLPGDFRCHTLIELFPVVKGRLNSAGSCESGGFMSDTCLATPWPSPLQPSTDWEQLLEIPHPAALPCRADFHEERKTCFPLLGCLTTHQSGHVCHPTGGPRYGTEEPQVTQMGGTKA